jgi:hypothetical protein
MWASRHRRRLHHVVEHKGTIGAATTASTSREKSDHAAAWASSRRVRGACRRSSREEGPACTQVWTTAGGRLKAWRLP